MSMTVPKAAAIFKRRFDQGETPIALQSTFPVLSVIPRDTDDGGDDFQTALQNGDPQASSSEYAVAVDSFFPGTYNRFLTPMVYHYSLVRIQGPAMERAKKRGDKAFLDLCKSEGDGGARTELKNSEIYVTRSGTGFKGRVSAGSTVGSANIALADGDDIACFNLNERLHGYNSTDEFDLTQNALPGSAVVTGIVRNPDANRLSVTGTWSGAITGITAGTTFLCRAGDGPLGSAARVFTGLDQWVRGGQTPGPLFSCDRNQDPVGLAGQLYDGTNRGYEEGFIDCEALLGYQSVEGDRVALMATRDVANLKKVAASRMSLERMDSAIAGLSFETVSMAGDYGKIRIISSPLVKRSRFYMGPLKDVRLNSIGPVPRLLHWNSERMITVANDDAAEIRFGIYGRFVHRNPFSWIRGINWGL